LEENRKLLAGPNEIELVGIANGIIAECRDAETNAMQARKPSSSSSSPSGGKRSGDGSSDERESGLSAAEELSFDAEVVQEQEQE